MLINIKNLLKSFRAFLFPKKCVGCSTPDFWICDKCLRQIPKSFENPFTWSFSVFEYKNRVIRKAIWLIKFNKKYSALADLEKVLRESFDEFLFKKGLEKSNVVLVPIPITKRSQAKRGYNQSLLLAKVLVKGQNDFEICEKVLVKSKNHLPQNKIKNRVERMSNVKNSFAIKNPEKVHGKIIVLIDDVTTTGATLEEARKVLNKAKAKKVFAFTVAH